MQKSACCNGGSVCGVLPLAPVEQSAEGGGKPGAGVPVEADRKAREGAGRPDLGYVFCGAPSSIRETGICVGARGLHHTIGCATLSIQLKTTWEYESEDTSVSERVELTWRGFVKFVKGKHRLGTE